MTTRFIFLARPCGYGTLFVAAATPCCQKIEPGKKPCAAKATHRAQTFLLNKFYTREHTAATNGRTKNGTVVWLLRGQSKISAAPYNMLGTASTLALII